MAQSDPQPIQSNPWLNILNQFFATLIQYGDKVAVIYAQGQVPFLAWPIIGTVFADAAAYLANQFSMFSQKLLDNVVLDVMENWDNSQVISMAKKVVASGGTNAQDVQNLAAAEATAVSWPGVGIISRF